MLSAVKGALGDNTLAVNLASCFMWREKGSDPSPGRHEHDFLGTLPLSVLERMLIR